MKTNMKRWWPLFAAALMMGLGAAAGADTVKFKDGSSLEGKATTLDDGSIEVQCGGASIQFPADKIDTVETNNKTGDPEQISRIREIEFEKMKTQQTGMTRPQRDIIRAVLGDLWSPDEGVRKDARDKLIRMDSEMPVLEYLRAKLKGSTALIAPELLSLIVELDREGSHDILLQYAQSAETQNRVAALRLIVSYKKDEDLDIVARGMVDFEDDVRIETAKILAETGSKRVTPALIEGVKSLNPQVSNVSIDALKLIWSEDIETLDEKLKPVTADDWSTFWSSKSNGVENAIDPSKLVPLVTEEQILMKPYSCV